MYQIAGNELAKRNAVKEDLACSGSSPARGRSIELKSARTLINKGEHMKKIERWFYLQLQLMLESYFRRGNPYFTYNETHKRRIK